MGLLSFLKRNRNTDTPSASKPSADDVQRVRTRSRQRLIGAVVLLGIGIIGFPLVFETQPRPIPVNIPIEIPRKDGAAPLVAPAPRPRQEPAKEQAKPQAKAPAQMITETAADAGKEIPAPAASAPEKAPPAQPARVKTEDKPAAKPDAAAKDGRYIVQVGAFAEVSAARDARLKVEKLGLKTYTQVVDTDGGKRIRVRVGPFASRDEADKAAGKIKSAGLSSAVLGL
jgi:DedD protein